MPKYYQDKICGYYLYFTSFCTVECMHVHASDRKLTEEGSAKFFVKEDGNTVLQKRGILNDREISKIQEYIKRHYKEMYPCIGKPYDIQCVLNEQLEDEHIFCYAHIEGSLWP